MSGAFLGFLSGLFGVVKSVVVKWGRRSKAAGRGWMMERVWAVFGVRDICQLGVVGGGG